MLDKPSKQRAVLLGGAIITVISGVPGLSLINCCCCAGIMVGGLMGVYFHRQDFQPGMAPFESSDALVVGLLAGLVGAVGATILGTLFSLLLGGFEAELLGGFYDRLLSELTRSGTLTDDMADQLRDQMERSFEESTSFGGIMANLFVAIIVYPVFAMLGGLIGYGIFNKKQTPAPQQ